MNQLHTPSVPDAFCMKTRQLVLACSLTQLPCMRVMMHLPHVFLCLSMRYLCLFRFSGVVPSNLGNNTKLVEWMPQNDLLGKLPVSRFLSLALSFDCICPSLCCIWASWPLQSPIFLEAHWLVPSGSGSFRWWLSTIGHLWGMNKRPVSLIWETKRRNETYRRSPETKIDAPRRPGRPGPNALTRAFLSLTAERDASVILDSGNSMSHNIRRLILLPDWRVCMRRGREAIGSCHSLPRASTSVCPFDRVVWDGFPPTIQCWWLWILKARATVPLKSLAWLGWPTGPVYTKQYANAFSTHVQIGKCTGQSPSFSRMPKVALRKRPEECWFEHSRGKELYYP